MHEYTFINLFIILFMKMLFEYDTCVLHIVFY
jgi:hypothetical protein